MNKEKNGEISAAGVAFRYRDLGSGDPVLWLGDPEKSRALQALVAAQHRVIVLQPAISGPPPLVPAIAEAMASLGVSRFGLIAESGSAAAALELALDQPERVAALVLLAPTLIDAQGQASTESNKPLVERLNALSAPLLTLFGTKDRTASPEAARHYRARAPTSSIIFVYDAGHDLGADRPEAVAELVLDFLARGERFLVRQTSDQLYP